MVDFIRKSNSYKGSCTSLKMRRIVTSIIYMIVFMMMTFMMARNTPHNPKEGLIKTSPLNKSPTVPISSDSTTVDNTSTRFALLVQEMKQAVEDHCQLLQKNETLLQEILNITWRVKVKPSIEGIKYPFDVLNHRSDFPKPRDNATLTKYSNSHVGHIAKQIAGTIRETLSAKPEGSPIGAFDIGVNYGWITFTIASMGIDVYSFEPMQSNIRTLRTSLCLSPPEIRSHVTLFDFGLSNKEQECMILSLDNNIGDGQVICHEDKEKAATFQLGKSKVREIVKLRRLDDVLPTEQEADADLMSKIAVIKMDTEGHEPFLVEGAKEFFRKFKPPVVHSEFASGHMTSVHADPHGMMSFFVEELGYTVKENRPHHWGRMGKDPLSMEVALDMTKFKGLHDVIFELPHTT